MSNDSKGANDNDAQELQQYQKELIEGAMSVGALKFGSFTLKSGRISPYFINAGLLSTGALISTVASSYAALLAQHYCNSDSSPGFDVLFGPAYKGIPFAAATALVLHRTHKLDIAYAFDRKEAKAHGEGGRIIGASVRGKRVVILDDVMTAGTAVRQAIELIRSEGGRVVGVVMLLDREEMSGASSVEGGSRSTVRDVEGLLDEGGRVRTVLRMRDLMGWLAANGQSELVQQMKSYWEMYGIKD